MSDGVRPGVRPDVRAARVSSAAPKKKSFDRGGPVWPPRSNVTNDRLRGGSGGALPPQPKTGGSGGQRPPAKNILTWRTLFTKTIDANKWHAAKCFGRLEHQLNFGAYQVTLHAVLSRMFVFGKCFVKLFVKTYPTALRVGYLYLPYLGMP